MDSMMHLSRDQTLYIWDLKNYGIGSRVLNGEQLYEIILNLDQWFKKKFIHNVWHTLDNC